MIFESQYLVVYFVYLFTVSRDMKLDPQQAPLYVSNTTHICIEAIFLLMFLYRHIKVYTYAGFHKLCMGVV